MVPFSVVLVALSTYLFTDAEDELPSEVQRSVWARIRSEYWRQRETGLGELLAAGKPTQPAVASILFQLLAIENKYIVKKFKEGGVGEAFSDPYYARLLGATFEAYKHDPNAERFAELARGSYNTFSPFAFELSRDAPKYLTPLQQLALSRESEYWRLDAAWLIGQAIIEQRFETKDRSAALAIIANSLNDVNSEVRFSAVGVLERIGGVDAHRFLVAARNRAKNRVPAISKHEMEKLNVAVAATSATGTGPQP